VIKYAHQQAKDIRILVCETRPLLQGARLTALELKQAGVPFWLITDSMAGHFMQKGYIDLVITGADRIAANGDTANKIGTYALALLAGYHNLPFYIAAPSTTFDAQTATGKDIVIEQRPSREVTFCAGTATAPEGTRASNPAFDVTPAGLITGYITDTGIIWADDIAGFLNSVSS
jgi:methylthioribose-1-phosphate isomerase